MLDSVYWPLKRQLQDPLYIGEKVEIIDYSSYTSLPSSRLHRPLFGGKEGLLLAVHACAKILDIFPVNFHKIYRIFIQTKNANSWIDR